MLINYQREGWLLKSPITAYINGQETYKLKFDNIWGKKATGYSPKNTFIFSCRQYLTTKTSIYNSQGKEVAKCEVNFFQTRAKISLHNGQFYRIKIPIWGIYGPNMIFNESNQKILTDKSKFSLHTKGVLDITNIGENDINLDLLVLHWLFLRPQLRRNSG